MTIRSEIGEDGVCPTCGQTDPLREPSTASAERAKLISITDDSGSTHARTANDWLELSRAAMRTPSSVGENIGDLQLWQGFLEWNRAQPEPLVLVGNEYAVAQHLCRMLSARSATAATIKEALVAASPLILQAWADRCGIDVTDERVQEANKVGWPHDYGLFEAGWNALASALISRADRGSEDR